MTTTPPPTWPIEPTILYVTTYYSTNADGAQAVGISEQCLTYEKAVESAKAMITANANAGVVLISQVTGYIVYPSVPWKDF